MVRRLLLALSILICTTSLALDVEARGFQAWYVDSLVKVFPNTKPERSGRKVPELWAARNQHISLQLAIRSSEDLTVVNAQAEPLQGPQGSVISSVVAHPVGYVVVGSHSQDTPADELVGEAPGWFPDVLQDFPLDLKRDRTQPVWVTVSVPPDAAPGDYRGAIVIQAGDRRLARREYRLRVVSAAVPAARSLKVTNWFTLSDKVSKQFYGIAQFTPEWWTLLANIAGVMADHRQNVVITPLLDLVQPQVEAGQIQYDFSNFDRWVKTFQKAGVIGYIEGSHLLGRAGSYDAALTVNCLLVEDGQVSKQTLPPDDPRVFPFLRGFLTALNAHLEAKGWKSIYYQHILDEAHGTEPPYYARFAELVHEYLPGVPTMDAVDAEQMPAELEKNCDVWVPQLGRFDNQIGMIEQRIQAGHDVWFYTCLFPNKRYLNRLIDYPLLKVRLLHWLNFRYNFTGFLHWGWNFWTPEPILDTQPVIDANTQLLPPGDAFIVYPDRSNKTVHASIRLEVMREGIEDYEMLHELKAKNPAEADRLASDTITSFTEYVRDPAAFRKIEQRLLEDLSK